MYSVVCATVFACFVLLVGAVSNAKDPVPITVITEIELKQGDSLPAGKCQVFGATPDDDIMPPYVVTGGLVGEGKSSRLFVYINGRQVIPHPDRPERENVAQTPIESALVEVSRINRDLQDAGLSTEDTLPILAEHFTKLPFVVSATVEFPRIRIVLEGGKEVFYALGASPLQGAVSEEHSMVRRVRDRLADGYSYVFAGEGTGSQCIPPRDYDQLVEEIELARSKSDIVYEDYSWSVLREAIAEAMASARGMK